MTKEIKTIVRDFGGRIYLQLPEGAVVDDYFFDKQAGGYRKKIMTKVMEEMINIMTFSMSTGEGALGPIKDSND